MEANAEVPQLQARHNLAINSAWTWGRSSRLQAERLLDGSSIWDAYLLMVALRQMIRAAEMAQKSLQKRQAQQILNSALKRFRTDLPELVDARDIIEHFDEYAVGKGALQEADRAADPTLTDFELAQQYTTRLEGTLNEPTVWVGHRAIEVAKVQPAVQRLFNKMWAAAKAEDGD
ncbi:hypothetical protein [Paractinoplanes brasiliensis]|uniref:HEPN domain-containing protein n=1 Tax=Paractinoplanes brasiliensis TaxID=52695 RepID=A0A4R6JLH3_9ACTN|nr:hypothetical protein [Actinoplanes brasiliensis]TDO37164.1 hypothetical protein C8E87_0769 [Actinoplanes brasiliensis]GID32919.1 hypothetical protein Abr02nite_79020 [Actinoplanes brasiliensis]